MQSQVGMCPPSRSSAAHSFLVLPGWHPFLVFRQVGLPAESTSYRSGYAEHTRGQQYGWFRPNMLPGGLLRSKVTSFFVTAFQRSGNSYAGHSLRAADEAHCR